MNKLIYTDLDVRPDLLTAEERSRFPAELSNEDRRAILAITRERMDCVDYDGHPMMDAGDWIQAYTRYVDGFDQKNYRPEFRDTIYRDVVIPQTGEVVQANAGFSEMIQRLMDSGVVVDAYQSNSAMMTDHPGMRWLHDPIGRVAHIDAPPGTHIFATHESQRPRMVFPTDSHARFFNDTLTVEAIRESADKAGLIVTGYRNPAQPQQAIEVRLPYLMDGTDYDDFLQLAHEHADRQAESGQLPDRQAQLAQFKASKQAVADAHGGYALYSDDMILDRFSRFERTLQRAMVSDRMVAVRQQPVVHYEDYLTPAQLNDIQSQAEQRYKQLADERRRPYVYQRYSDSPGRVDEVARRAGFLGGYTDYLSHNRPAKPGDDRWGEFQKLEQKHLHSDRAGILKLFRIENGIRSDVRRWKREQYSQAAEPVMKTYREAGYPVDKLKDFYLTTNYQDKTEVVTSINGKTISRPVDTSTMNRMKLNACTPFEAAIESLGKELGWRGRLILPVGEEVIRHLNQDNCIVSGQMPVKCGDRIYHVDAHTWDLAHALERFRQMPPAIQQQVLDTPPPVRDISQRSPEVAKEHIDAVQQRIDMSVNDIMVGRVKDDQVGVRCMVNGQQMPTVTISFSKLRNEAGLLPGVDPALLARQQMAACHADAVFPSEERGSTLKR